MIIETERLVLRPFTEEDAGDVLEYLREPAVNCFACMKLNFLEEAKAEMQKRCGETEYYFAITLKDTGKVIGEIEAYPETGEQHSDENDPKDTFSPCWMLNKKSLQSHPVAIAPEPLNQYQFPLSLSQPVFMAPVDGSR